MLKQSLLRLLSIWWLIADDGAVSIGDRYSVGDGVSVANFPTITNRNEAMESPKEAVLVMHADMVQWGKSLSNMPTSTAGFGTVDRVAQNKKACACHINAG